MLMITKCEAFGTSGKVYFFKYLLNILTAFIVNTA